MSNEATGLLVVAIFITVIVGLVVLISRRPASSTPPPSVEILAPKLRRYNVFTLGGRAAGKTCFLASMFKRLSVFDPDVGFFLDASREQAAKLREIYAMMTDPYGEWPNGTIAAKEWLFTTYVLSADGTTRFPAFEFNYLDYAGGHLKDAAHADVLAATERIAKADAVLVLLDGEKILHRLAGTEQRIVDPGERLGGDLDFLLPYLNSSGGKPVHFVVTKSDLFEGRFSFDAVRHCLLSYQGFRGFVEYRLRSNLPTRLIPVSSVGTGFATMDDQGVTTKNADVQPFPRYVEVSLAATLVDVFEAVLKSLKEGDAREIVDAASRPQQVAFSRWRYLAAVLEGARALPLPFSAAGALQPILDVFIARREQAERDFVAQRTAALGVVKDRDSAIRGAVVSHLALLRAFEVHWPQTSLIRGRSEAQYQAQFAS